MDNSYVMGYDFWLYELIACDGTCEIGDCQGWHACRETIGDEYLSFNFNKCYFESYFNGYHTPREWPGRNTDDIVKGIENAMCILEESGIKCPKKNDTFDGYYSEDDDKGHGVFYYNMKRFLMLFRNHPNHMIGVDNGSRANRFMYPWVEHKVDSNPIPN